MVALESKRALRDLGATVASPGMTTQLNVLVDDNTVVDDLLETRVGDLVALGIESRRPEHDVIGLPMARLAGRIDPWRTTLEASWLPRVIPSLIDAAAVIMLGIKLAPAVKNLNLVPVLEIDTRVAAFRNHELDMDLDITEVGCGAQVRDMTITVHQDTAVATMSHRREGLGIVTGRRGG